MITSLYGLWIEDIETSGHNPIRYFDTEEGLMHEMQELKEKITLPIGKRLFMIEHGYDTRKDAIVEFNYNERIYL